MRPIRLTINICTIVLATLTLGLVSGCPTRPGMQNTQTTNQRSNQAIRHPSDVFTLYFYREANYQGSGRLHFLIIDGNKVGPLEAENYYRIDLWPGQYHLSVYLPEEEFLGWSSPPTQTSIKLTVRNDGVPGHGIYKYTDGKGIYREHSDGAEEATRLTAQRVLAGSLTSRDTAQVKSLYDTRYDGPALKEKAHGMGMLTWDDGSVFVGRFVFGDATNEGKFFTVEGPVYMGPKRKGRPTGPGVWMTHDGHILYAGDFLGEVPHGSGIRTGPDGPEFCKYDRGNDITLTLRERVLMAIEEEDLRMAQQMATNDLSLETIGSNTGASQQQNHVEPADPETISYVRILAKQKEIESEIRSQINKRRDWCKEEFLLGRRLCACAPLADDFENWTSCDSR